mmetsp:Transcript_76954/g.249299  ORF Transcript_76954/g.249299 Transcript_76954/m.249299 type:complete len:488 (-) Transcript_76954:60-1523(-)
MIMYEVCTLQRPFVGEGALDVTEQIAGQDEAAPFPEAASCLIPLQGMCLAMLNKDVGARPTLGELLREQALLKDEVLALEKALNWEASLVPLLEERLGQLEEARILEPLSPLPGGDVVDWSPQPPSMPGRALLMRLESVLSCDGKVAPLAHVVSTAAGIQDIDELTIRKSELTQLVTQLMEHAVPPPPGPPSVQALACDGGDAPPPPPPVPPTPAPPSTPLDLTSSDPLLPASSSDGFKETFAVMQELAELIHVRLHCIEVLQTLEPDAAELTSALERVQELGLQDEACGQALAEHAERLCMKAAGTLVDTAAPIEQVEQAAEMLETVRRSGAAAAAAVAAVAVARTAGSQEDALSVVSRHLQQAHEAQQRIGLRCSCGSILRVLSVPREATITQVFAHIAQKFSRPSNSLKLMWRDGGAQMALETEAHWQQCLRLHPKGLVEVILPPPATRVATAVGGRRPRQALGLPIAPAMRGIAGRRTRSPSR